MPLVLQPYQQQDREELERIAASARVLRACNVYALADRGSVLQAVSPAHPQAQEILPIQYSIRNLVELFHHSLNPPLYEINSKRSEPLHYDLFTLYDKEAAESRIGFAAFWDGRWPSGTRGNSYIDFAFVKPSYEDYKNLDRQLQAVFFRYQEILGEGWEQHSRQQGWADILSPPYTLSP